METIDEITNALIKSIESSTKDAMTVAYVTGLNAGEKRNERLKNPRNILIDFIGFIGKFKRMVSLSDGDVFIDEANQLSYSADGIISLFLLKYDYDTEID